MIIYNKLYHCSKILIYFTFVSLLFLSSFVRAEAWELKVKKTNIDPEIGLVQLNGEKISLRKAINTLNAVTKNENVILHFWATWCPPCIKEIPVLLKEHIKQKDDPTLPGVIIVAVEKDSEAVKEFIEASLPKGEKLPKAILPVLDRKNILLRSLTHRSALPYSILIQKKIATYFHLGPYNWATNPFLPNK